MNQIVGTSQKLSSAAATSPDKAPRMGEVQLIGSPAPLNRTPSAPPNPSHVPSGKMQLIGVPAPLNGTAAASNRMLPDSNQAAPMPGGKGRK